MKTQKISSFRAFPRIAIFAILLIAVSCKSKDGSAQGAQASGTKTGVKAPAVDINTAAFTGNLEAVQQHIQAGSDLNEKDPYGSCPLITATVFGKTEVAKALIAGGADLNFQNKDGSTALHTAAFFCRPEIVKMLLAKGADKTIKNNYNSTAFESVAGPFADVKNVYDMMGKMLGPMGLQLDYAYIEKTRPEIAATLK